MAVAVVKLGTKNRNFNRANLLDRKAKRNDNFV